MNQWMNNLNSLSRGVPPCLANEEVLKREKKTMFSDPLGVSQEFFITILIIQKLFLACQPYQNKLQLGFGPWAQVHGRLLWKLDPVSISWELGK